MGGQDHTPPPFGPGGTIPHLGEFLTLRVRAKAMLGALSTVAYARRTAPSPAQIDRLLASHWRRFDAVLDDDEEAFVDRHGLPAGAAAPPLGHGSSAYGEVTRVGARQLFFSSPTTSASDRWGLAFTRFSLQRLSIFFASYSLWALYILEDILEY